MTTINTNGRVDFLGHVQNFNGPIYYASPNEIRNKFDLGLHLFNAPEIDDTLFVGRSTELQQMHETLLPDLEFPKRKVLVLGGMGGIGKTQLAIVYAKKYRTCYQSIFWLDASSKTSLEASIHSMSTLVLNTKDRPYKDEEIMTNVLSWFSMKENSQWLLIFDNHDDPDEYQISRYLPSAAHGSILITSRLPESISGFKLRVSALSSEIESLTILQTRSERADVLSDPDALKLAKRLDGYPLALTSAGAYLKLATAVSFAEYLQKYEAKWRISSRRPTSLPEYSQRTLYTTWNISYERLQKADPEAAKLLTFLAYLSHENISYELLHAGIGQGTDIPEWFLGLAKDKFEFSDIMTSLVSYCFLEVHSHSSKYRMHICVHDWTLEGLNQKGVDPEMYWIAFRCVSNSIDLQDLDNLDSAAYASIGAHAVWISQDRFLRVMPVSMFQNRSDTIFVADLLRQRGQFEASERVYQNALVNFEKELGPDHLVTLQIVNAIGVLNVNQGRLTQAEKMYQRAMSAYEATDKPVSQDAKLMTLINLGSLYTHQNKLDKAREIFKEVLVSSFKDAGSNKAILLNAMASLATLYRHEGKLVESEQIRRKILSSLENSMEPDHTFILTSIGNLANVYTDQGELTQAEQLLQKVVSSYQNKLGPDHPTFMIFLNNLGTIYARQGKTTQAEEVFKQVLAGKEVALGPDHVSTLYTNSNLGNIYYEQARMEEAEKHCKKALTGYEQVLGPDHTTTLIQADTLGMVYKYQGKLGQAEQLFLRASEGLENLLGFDHRATLDSFENLGSNYLLQGKMEESKEILQRTLAGVEKALGPNDSLTHKAAYHLGMWYDTNQDKTEAEKLYLRALAGMESSRDRGFKTYVIDSLGDLYKDQGKLAMAEQMYHRVMANRGQVYGLEHALTIDTKRKVGDIYARQEKYEQAEQLFEQILACCEKTSWPAPPFQSNILRNLAWLYHRRDQLDQAEIMAQRALKGYEQELEPEHEAILSMLNMLGDIYVGLEKRDEAREMYDRALEAYTKVFGLEHASTVKIAHKLRYLDVLFLLKDMGREENGKKSL